MITKDRLLDIHAKPSMITYPEIIALTEFAIMSIANQNNLVHAFDKNRLSDDRNSEASFKDVEVVSENQLPLGIPNVP